MKPAGPIKKAGTELGAYQGPEEGPFRCGRCVHFMAAAEASGGKDECWHPEVIKDPDMEIDDDGHALVDARGCCEYFRPGKTITKKKAKKLKADSKGVAEIMTAEEKD
jgi:hypothetical protein